MQGVKGIAPVEIPIKVSPSTRAANMEVMYKDDDGETVPITPAQELFGACGEAITGLGELLH